LEASSYPEEKIPDERLVVLHFDNAPVHNSKSVKEKMILSGFTWIKHPPYSPYLAPYDFFLFGYIKEKLKDTGFSDVEKLYVAIQGIMTAIPGDPLLSVFFQWVKRV
jgi:hypothetical protein